MKRNCYIFSDTIIKRKDNTLCVQTVRHVEKITEEQQILSGMRNDYYEVLESRIYPIENINAIYACGWVNFNSMFLSLIGRHSIPMHIFNNQGEYRGMFIPGETANSANIMIKQACMVSDEHLRLKTARKITLAAARNFLVNLKHYYSRGANLSQEISQLTDILDLISKADSHEKLTELYSNINTMRKVIMKEMRILPVKTFMDFFGKAAETLFNFGKLMMYSVCLTEMYRIGIDPRISFIKSPGKYNLADEIKKIFEPLITDRLMFRIIREKIISKIDVATFRRYGTLAEETRKFFIKEFDMRLFVSRYDKLLNIHIPLSELIRREFENLRNFINGESEYEPYTLEDN